MQWMWMQWMQMPSIHLLWRVTRIYAFALGGPSRSLFLMLSANLSTNSWSSRRQSWGSQVTQVTPRYDMIWHGMTRYFQFKSFTTPSPQGKLEYRPSLNVSNELHMRRQSRLWRDLSIETPSPPFCCRSAFCTTTYFPPSYVAQIRFLRSSKLHFKEVKTSVWPLSLELQSEIGLSQTNLFGRWLHSD